MSRRRTSSSMGSSVTSIHHWSLATSSRSDCHRRDRRLTEQTGGDVLDLPSKAFRSKSGALALGELAPKDQQVEAFDVPASKGCLLARHGRRG